MTTSKSQRNELFLGRVMNLIEYRREIGHQPYEIVSMTIDAVAKFIFVMAKDESSGLRAANAAADSLYKTVEVLVKLSNEGQLQKLTDNDQAERITKNANAS